ncbi:glucuronate isomerase [Natronobacillus azotifigens]|uniref:Uronate isomerase n=1 Tax=Natronobacillus azotifigens TaxID=472978 RepID=A0A9J6REU3_9BACI|nr:glucuronate isomerase [Natronobacillus azotifigens]MCZ0704274.1 glucuronate isomerase [Natronobacillus azotifigens]
MKRFMGEDFQLQSDLAIRLYNQYVKELPIIDYHCHLSANEIYENRGYTTLTEAWLAGDHYKWRAMRAVGIDEHYITGDASDYEKFLAWSKTVPQLIGNPLYHWTHMELQQFFDIHETLDEKTAPLIWEKANLLLNSGELNVRDLIEKSGVEVICTTDDPIDSLEFHQSLSEDQSFNVRVKPSFRPDKGLAIDSLGFLDWVDQLSSLTEMTIQSYQDFLKALGMRIDYFHQIGCRISDHGLDHFEFIQASEEEVSIIFNKVRNKESISAVEVVKYKSLTLVFLGEKYQEHNWVMQLHMNALRNNNSKMLNQIGPDTGFDAINDHLIAQPLRLFLDQLEREGALPRTIVYSLNPNDLPILATIMGSFQGDAIAGKMQLGSAWWFNDTKRGMLKQMEVLADTGVLSQFIGMLTDSRSFLSFSRHDYFRRILCNLLAQWVIDGEYPCDIDRLGKIASDISYYNAKNYFKF